MLHRYLARICVLAIATVVALQASALRAERGEKTVTGGDSGPQRGGTLEVVTLFSALPAAAWDPADWHWKSNHDAGQVYEQLFTADLSKAASRGGRHRFQLDGWIPPDAIRGELAQRWELLDDPPRLRVELRRGVMFPAKPGVMASRELVADDVVQTYRRYDASPKRIATVFDHIERVEAVDRHTVLFTFRHHHALWDFRFGWGYSSAIHPREVADAGAGDWRNVNGTGPFLLVEHRAGASTIFERNPLYWDREAVEGRDYAIPFVDRLVYRLIRDEASQHAALRSGKIDLLESIRWTAVDELKRNVPQLQWARRLSAMGQFLALRLDVKPFDDARVRRALNLAIDKRQIVEAYYGGHAELFAYPQHPDFSGYFEPLEAMPAEVRELFVHDPAKARTLMAQAGYPDGFSFKVQVNAADADQMELLPLIAAQLEKIGVRVEIQPVEYATLLSTMTANRHAPGVMTRSAHTHPIVTLRRSFETRQVWNVSRFTSTEFDRRIAAVSLEPDESKRRDEIRALTRMMLAEAPYVWLPVPYVYMAWWPWVRNYGGELAAGAFRPGPVYARIWIDHALKRRLGY